MGTPNRYTIVERLKTQLETITTGNGYKSTVVAVERVARIPEEILKSSRRPFIGIMPGSEAFGGQPSQRANVSFTIYLTLIVDGGTATVIGERLSNLQDDVFTTLRANNRLELNGADAQCASIQPINAGTSEGDATMLAIGAGYMELELLCRYWRPFGAS